MELKEIIMGIVILIVAILLGWFFTHQREKEENTIYIQDYYEDSISGSHGVNYY